MADNFFVTAILVSHDGATWLPEAIAGISAQTRSVDRMIAVDTGSIDNSVKMLTGAGLTVIKTDRDAGFGDAIALALGSSKKLTGDDQEELIWILHDDCAPTRTAPRRASPGRLSTSAPRTVPRFTECKSFCGDPRSFSAEYTCEAVSMHFSSANPQERALESSP
jgi:hypothetical protein